MKTEKQPCVSPVRPLQDEGEGGWPQLTLAPVGGSQYPSGGDINITAVHYIDGHNGYSDYKNNLLQPTAYIYIILGMYYCLPFW